MKKLLTLMIMLGLFAMPSITTEAALTPPSSYDYSFVYDATDGEFQFKDGTNSYTPEFTRTADGIYFNYEYIGDGDGLLPFEVTLRFNRSNTSWTLGTTGYIATSSFIGSDSLVGSVPNKFSLNLNNQSNNDYILYIDSSTTNTSYSVNHTVNNKQIILQSPTNFVTFSNLLTTLYLGSKQNMFFGTIVTSAIRYIDAFYLQDIGTSFAYTAGVESTTAYQEGYETGFGFGYQAGVEEDNAYSLGYARGLSEGADMETGSSILIFVVAAIGFIMMIFGFTTKRGIFNLLSVGAFVVLGAMLAQYIGFIIIAIGLVLINVYYAFWGDL